MKTDRDIKVEARVLDLNTGKPIDLEWPRRVPFPGSGDAIIKDGIFYNVTRRKYEFANDGKSVTVYLYVHRLKKPEGNDG